MAGGVWNDDIHIFEYEDRKILYQVSTGTFFEIDGLVSDILHLPRAQSKEELIAAVPAGHELTDLVGAIEELEGLEILSFGPSSPFENVPDTSDRGSSAPLPITMTLHVSHACNISCSYCFALGGNYGGPSTLMDSETARRSVDWLLSSSSEAGRCQLDFFGGEPLLNFELIREVVEYAREEAEKQGVDISFGMTTNGTLLSGEMLEFVMREDIGVMVSLDGSADTHNETRKFHDGGDTHETTVKNASKLAEKRPDLLMLRATMTSSNLDMENIAEELLQIGAGTVSVAPTTEHPSSPTAIRAEHLKELRTHLKRLSKSELDRIRNRAGTSHSHFGKMIHQLLTPTRKEYGCGGGKTYFGVSVDGSIYFCSAFASMPEFKMGDVFNGIDPLKKASFDSEIQVDRREPCKSCWARNLCGGSCIYDAQITNGDHLSPNLVACEQIRYSYELSMGMALELNEDHPETFESLMTAAPD
jgi:uncharacterized protein